jgi:hypothetical protein
MPIFVDVTVLGTESTTFTFTLLLSGVDSKLVPVIVIEFPGATIVGVKLVIVGTPLLAVTVNEVLLVAVPSGDVTAIAPVVAPAGTVATIDVLDAETIEAIVPLKVTVSCAGLKLKPDPWIVTCEPTGPLFGLNSINELAVDV